MSDTYYRLVQIAGDLIVHHGRIGSSGKVLFTHFNLAAEAEREAFRLHESKKKNDNPEEIKGKKKRKDKEAPVRKLDFEEDE
jgi:predicted DNA-binding WGR domain protein